MLASQEFKADPGTGQDRLVTEDIGTDHRAKLQLRPLPPG
jgi:hypothetical protein